MKVQRWLVTSHNIMFMHWVCAFGLAKGFQRSKNGRTHLASTGVVNTGMLCEIMF